MNILLFLLILLVLVLVHEFGHFIVAKVAKIRVDEFAFGFPPRLFSIKKGETRYSFNLLPIGGYVKIYGEDPNDVDARAHDKKRSFVGQHRLIQAAVIVAGVFMNIVLAWVFLSATFMVGTPASPEDPYGAYVKDVRLTVLEVRPDTPAATSGLRSGDVIVQITDGEAAPLIPTSPEAVQNFIGPREGMGISVSYLRGGDLETLTVTPVAGIVPDRAAIGIAMDMYGTLRLPPHLAFWEGAKRTYEFTLLTATGIWDFLSGIFTGRGDFAQVTGPVGIVKAVGVAADSGIANLLFFTALISINLAIINLIPFPALDGGRLLFVIIEGITRRPIPAKFQNRANVVGFAFLMLLMIAVTWSDIAKLL